MFSRGGRGHEKETAEDRRTLADTVSQEEVWRAGKKKRVRVVPSGSKVLLEPECRASIGSNLSFQAGLTCSASTWAATKKTSRKKKKKKRYGKRYSSGTKQSRRKKVEPSLAAPAPREQKKFLKRKTLSSGDSPNSKGAAFRRATPGTAVLKHGGCAVPSGNKAGERGSPHQAE